MNDRAVDYKSPCGLLAWHLRTQALILGEGAHGEFISNTLNAAADALLQCVNATDIHQQKRVFKLPNNVVSFSKVRGQP